MRNRITKIFTSAWDSFRGGRSVSRIFQRASRHALGEGFTWETQDRERDRQLVQAAWETSLAYLSDSNQKLVVLDEVNVALKLGYLELDQVLRGLEERPELTHVALTGRGAPDGLIQRADLVTEMSLIKHPFREQGVKAQQGIEF